MQPPGLYVALCDSCGSTEGTTVYDALEKGFDDLVGLCDVVVDEFTVARDAFNAEQQA